jgi:hypothetical protein
MGSPQTQCLQVALPDKCRLPRRLPATPRAALEPRAAGRPADRGPDRDAPRDPRGTGRRISRRPQLVSAAPLRYRKIRCDVRCGGPDRQRRLCNMAGGRPSGGNMRTRLIKVSALLAGVLAGDCVAQSIGQTSSASTMENITRFHRGCHSRADLRGGDCLLLTGTVNSIRETALAFW